jgi:hypothetical protein
MTANRLNLVGLTVFVLTLTTAVSLAQNTSNPMQSGNTTNPILSGNTVAQPPYIPLSGNNIPVVGGQPRTVSPALPTAILNLSTGTNPFTGQPCSTPPTTGGTTTSSGVAFPSVYGPPPSAC